MPFEVPIFVNEFVNSRTAKTDGLVFDPDTGIIVDYVPVGNVIDEVVFIPSYIAVDNHDGTRAAVRVTGIAPGLFKNNTDIVIAGLSVFIDEIPDSAFEGATSLKYVIAPGATKIGNNAFSGCTSLEVFNLPIEVTEVGMNAFDRVPQISAIASNVEIAQAVASSGADSVSLDISRIPSDEIEGLELVVGEITSFELLGRDREYRGLSLKSDAVTTIVNGVTFTESTKIPLELSSANVTLDRVVVHSTGLALVLKDKRVAKPKCKFSIGKRQCITHQKYHSCTFDR
jgi:hypothetical protein